MILKQILRMTNSYFTKKIIPHLHKGLEYCLRKGKYVCKKIPPYINYFSVLTFIILTLIIIYISIYICEFEIKPIYKSILFFCFSLPALLLFTIIILHNKKASYKDYQENGYQSIKTNHFTLLALLLTFYATFFIGLLIFIEKPQEGEIVYLKDGTIGLRTWQSGVKIYDIKIHYHDSLNRWQQIPKEIIYDSLNWTKVHWNKGKMEEQAIINKIDLKSIDIRDSLSFLPDSSIYLKNCAIVFSPPNKNQQIFHNFRVECKVVFEIINKPVNELFPGFQIITFIDTCKVINEHGEKEYSDLFLQFNLGANNTHIPWIPALDYEPPTKYISPVNKMMRFGEFNNIKKGEKYWISAVVLNNTVLFLGHTDGTVKLFEAQMDTKNPVANN